MECNQFQSLFAKNRKFSSPKNSSELHESAEQSRTLTISIDITEILLKVALNTIKQTYYYLS